MRKIFAARYWARAALAVSLLTCALPAYAQEGALSITVTPTLFQLSISPGETWSSSVKIVNNNLYDATYYAQALDFEASGEDGAAKYIPLVNEVAATPQPYSLASWLDISHEPVTIKAGHSQEVQFTLHVPENAEPGGHYAAILVGTKPQNSLSGSGAKISSFVSSLMFVKIAGDIVESGRIREFSTMKGIYQDPKADFVLRFENTGNTHVRPEGDIEIYNMWGKERGSIAINKDSAFGNVLPKSIRKFKFSWEGEASPFDIGPYSAVVTLAYGEDGRKNITAKTYFWVIPTGPVIATLGTILVFILILAWFIRRYIRRALELERQRSLGSTPLVHESAIQTLMQPIKEGIIDLRSVAAKDAPQMVERNMPDAPSADREHHLTARQFASKYTLFFAFAAVVLISTVVAWWYFERALVQHRAYKIHLISSEVEDISQ